MKKTFLYVGTMLLFCSPFLVKAAPWEPPTDNAPNDNVDGPVWISPDTPQQGYVDLISSSDSTSLKLDPEATATPFNDLSIDPTNANSQPGLSINDGRSSAIPAASLWVTSSLSDKPAIYGYNDTSGYGGQFIGTSAPGLNVEGGIEFIGRGGNPTYSNTGLLYYNTTDNVFKYYNGSTWQELSSPWEINGDEIYHSQTAGTAKGVAIKTGDTTDPNDDYTLDIYRKAQSTSDRATYSRLEDVSTTDYASGALGLYDGADRLIGVKGSSPDYGVYGEATFTTDPASYGGYFKSISTGGRGVYGNGYIGGQFVGTYRGLEVSNSSGIGMESTGSSIGGVFETTSTSGGVGIRVTGPDTTTGSALQLYDGGISMEELTTLPTSSTDFGKLYVKSSDSKIYFQDDSGVEYDLTSGSGSADLADGTADGQFAFWDNTAGEWVYTETSEMVWDDTNKNVGVGTASPLSSSKFHVENSATSGNAIYGQASATGAILNVGGSFRSEGDNGYGVYGIGAATTNSTNYGGYFIAKGGSGRAVYGEADSSVGLTNYGGYFTADGPEARAVYGSATNSGASTNYGGYFTAAGSTSLGVYASGSSVGIYGRAMDSSGVGVFAYGPDTTTGSALRVYHGGIEMEELTTLPTNTAGYGKVYVKSSDSKLYFQDDSGVEYDLTSGSGSADLADGTADGQFAFWDNTAGEWVYTETSEMVWDDTNKRLGIGEATPNEALTASGALALSETTAPTNTASYGKFYVNSTDSLPYFVDDSGTEHALTGGGDANWDTDGDTGIQLEETADDDTIRFDTAGVQRGYIRENGNFFFGDEGGADDYIYGNVATGGLALESTSAISIGDNEGMGNGTELIVDDAHNRIYTYNNMGIGTNSSTYQLNVTESASAGRAVYGEATATGANTNYGGYFTAAGDSGVGVQGRANATGVIENYGGYFEASGDNGAGIKGFGSGQTGKGVYGEASYYGGTGTNNYGGYFTADGTSGVGVYGNGGYNQPTTANYGGYFIAQGGQGIGVYGEVNSNDTSNDHYAGYFSADSGNGIGLYANGAMEAARFEGSEVVISDGTDSLDYILAGNSQGSLYVGDILEVDGMSHFSNILYADTEVRSPIFYDLNNTDYYIDPASSTSGRFYGDLQIGYGSAADDDYLYFDQNNEYLRWYDSGGYFNLSDELRVGGDLGVTGNASVKDSLPLAPSYATGAGDLYVENTLEAGSSSYIGGNLYVKGSRLYLDNDYSYAYDYIYFGDDSASDEYMRYYNNNFYFSGTTSDASDIRLKKNIETLGSGLGIVKSLNPVTFDWKKNGEHSYGFIAQEMDKVLPELVTKPDEFAEDGDIMWGIDYDKITAVLTAAMQEQQEQIESQQKEIDELQEQVQYLMDKVK